MSRPRKKKTGQWYVWTRPGSIWWAWRYKPKNPEEREYLSTGKKKSEYTREQIERILDEVQGIVKVRKPHIYSIGWLEQYTMRTINIEGLAPNTIDIYRLAFMHLRKIYGKHYSILNIRRKDIITIKEYFIANNCKASTANIYLRNLSSAFERIRLDEIIGTNPFEKFKPMREKKASEKKKYLTLIELRDFLDFVKKNAVEDLFRLIRIYAGTGRRRLEILELEHYQVDIEKGIYRPIDIKSKGDKIRFTRKIPEEVFKDFKFFIDKYQERQYPFAIYQKDELTRKVRNLFDMKKIDVDKPIHIFRHTYQTQLDSLGFSRRQIQLIMGYSDESTVNIYRHNEMEESPNIGIGNVL